MSSRGSFEYPWQAAILVAVATGAITAAAGALGAGIQIAGIAGIVGSLPARRHLHNEAGRGGIPLWKIATELGPPAVVIALGGVLWVVTVLGCIALDLPTPLPWAPQASALSR